MDHVVVDVEIVRGPEELAGGWNETESMGVAVACLWEERTRRMRVYGQEDVNALKERLLEADRITGFNNLNFDFPVIWGVPKAQWLSSTDGLRAKLLPRTNDLLRRIWESCNLDPDCFRLATHGGYPLEKVARATIGEGKIGHGAEAPKWFKDGRVAKVVNYCADDVALTRDLAEFIDRYGYVNAPSGGKIGIRPWK